jgi:hypothetical protein
VAPANHFQQFFPFQAELRQPAFDGIRFRVDLLFHGATLGARRGATSGFSTLLQEKKQEVIHDHSECRAVGAALLRLRERLFACGLGDLIRRST